MKIRFVYQNFKHNGEDMLLTPCLGLISKHKYRTYGLSINWIYYSFGFFIGFRVPKGYPIFKNLTKTQNYANKL